MDILSIAGIIFLVISTIVISVGVWAILGKIAWYATWKWGLARQQIRSVRLGWNTGRPPEGKWVLVREYTTFDSVAGVKTSNKRDWDWAVMKLLSDDHMHSARGGFAMPVENCTGWMYIEEEIPVSNVSDTNYQ